jgi:hypothetical protein
MLKKLPVAIGAGLLILFLGIEAAVALDDRFRPYFTAE